jgi:hypothetical protein
MVASFKQATKEILAACRGLTAHCRPEAEHGKVTFKLKYEDIRGEIDNMDME